MKSLKKEFIMFVFQQFLSILLKADEKKYLQVYFEQCKYKVKKNELVSFIDNEVNFSSDDSEDLDE